MAAVSSPRRLWWRHEWGPPVLYLNLTDASPGDIRDPLAEFDVMLALLEPASAPLLVDLRRCSFDPAALNRWKAAWLKDDLKIPAIAVIGADAIHTVAMQRYNELRDLLGMAKGGKKLWTFDSESQAKDWLLGLPVTKQRKLVLTR